jgi:hypothetical protein
MRLRAVEQKRCVQIRHDALNVAKNSARIARPIRDNALALKPAAGTHKAGVDASFWYPNGQHPIDDSERV